MSGDEMKSKTNAAGRTERRGGRTLNRADPMRRKPGNLDDSTQRHLGKLIRTSYDELINQPVPERFVELLDALAKKQEKGN